VYKLVLFGEFVAHRFANDAQQCAKQQLETFAISHVISRLLQQPAQQPDNQLSINQSKCLIIQDRTQDSSVLHLIPTADCKAAAASSWVESVGSKFQSANRQLQISDAGDTGAQNFKCVPGCGLPAPNFVFLE